MKGKDIMGGNIFESSIRYHTNMNLNKGLENEEMIDGVMHYSKKGGKKVPVTVGKENKQEWYGGLVLFTNGGDIVEHLKKAKLIPTSLSFVEGISDGDNFLKFIDAVTKGDGAAIYDRASGKGTKLIISNTSPSLEEITAKDILPVDYLSEDGSVRYHNEYGWSNIGCRSELAARISRGINIGIDKGRNGQKEGYHPVDAYLIKHTIYNPLGFGPVVHLSREEMEMFFFRYAPDSNGQFINAEHGIVGVLRTYKLTGGRFTQVSEDLVHLNKNDRLAYNSSKLLVFPEKNKKYKIPTKPVLAM